MIGNAILLALVSFLLAFCPALRFWAPNLSTCVSSGGAAIRLSVPPKYCEVGDVNRVPFAAVHIDGYDIAPP